MPNYNGQPKKILTREQKDEIFKLAQDGHCVSSIMRITGISRMLINKYIKS
jgi:DNA invertase Pin-like site-specific DNA recombinase